MVKKLIILWEDNMIILIRLLQTILYSCFFGIVFILSFYHILTLFGSEPYHIEYSLLLLSFFLVNLYIFFRLNYLFYVKKREIEEKSRDNL